LFYSIQTPNSRVSFQVNLNFNEQVSSQVTATGVFGPLLNTAAAHQDIHSHTHTHPHTHAHAHNQIQNPSHEDPEIIRKHQLEEESNHQIQNGPPGKKPRLSNGYEHGNGNGIGGADRTNGNHLYEATPVPMEIDGDQDADGHAYPSPEQLPSPLVITNGPERGTQMEKVMELGTETTYLDLLDDNPSTKSTILLHCEWNPKNPSILAAAGTDALARMWNLAHTVTDDGTNGSHPQSSGIISTHPACTSLLGPNSPPSTLVNSMSWASDGSAILVASEELNGSAKIDAWTVDGRRIYTSAGMEAPIICLKWNFVNTLFLSISPLTNPETETKGTLIIVTSMTDPRTSQLVLPQHNLADQELDAVWTSDEDFIVCGGDVLMSYHFADGVITPSRKFETREDHALSKITFDPASKLLATASENGVIDVRITPTSPDRLIALLTFV
jgi:transducin (beta)-like 1